MVWRSRFDFACHCSVAAACPSCTRWSDLLTCAASTATMTVSAASVAMMMMMMMTIVTMPKVMAMIITDANASARNATLVTTMRVDAARSLGFSASTRTMRWTAAAMRMHVIAQHTYQLFNHAAVHQFEVSFCSRSSLHSKGSMHTAFLHPSSRQDPCTTAPTSALSTSTASRKDEECTSYPSHCALMQL